MLRRFDNLAVLTLALISPVIGLNPLSAAHKAGNQGKHMSSFIPLPITVTPEIRSTYNQDGFHVFHSQPLLSPGEVSSLHQSIEDVLRQKYDSGTPPTKQTLRIKNPRNTNELGFSNGSKDNVKVIQIINVHHSSSAFKKVVLSPVLGEVVCRLAGWDKFGGARVVQDQVWAKPPYAKPLVFHRDSPYFMFDNDEVVTVWLALDQMDEEIGPLEYAIGSHKWSNSRIGSAQVFFDDDHLALMRDAHSQETSQDASTPPLSISSASGLPAGCIAVHNGLTWHGSGRNQSGSRSRRGLGIHFVPANARWNVKEAKKSKVWADYVEGMEGDFCEVDDDQMPVTFRVDPGM